MAAPRYNLFRYVVTITNKKYSLFCPPARHIYRNTCQFDSRKFDTSMLETLACPLSKNTLRYDETASELINDDLGVAYKIVDGIPNLIPEEARMIKKRKDSTDDENANRKDDTDT